MRYYNTGIGYSITFKKKVLAICLIAAIQYGAYKGHTFIEVFSKRADNWFVKLIRKIRMTKKIKKIFISAEKLEKDSWQFAHDIYQKENYFDIIVGITRGGAQISIYMHEAFCVLSDKKPDYKIIEASSYRGINRAGDLFINNLDWLENTLTDGQKILLVDDIFDRGVTLKETKDAIIQRTKNKKIILQIAALYYKPLNSRVEIRPDFYFKTFKKDEWLFLPHELQGLSPNELQEKGFIWNK